MDSLGFIVSYDASIFKTEPAATEKSQVALMRQRN